MTQTQRDAFWTRIYEEMKVNQDIVIVVADMGTPIFDTIKKEFPYRFINVGIAEQNAILVASGLAKQGLKVFVYAIAPFITLRCYEQIRVQCSIMNIPLTIVGVGAGFSYDDSGPTHHLFEDIAIMRALPNMVVHSITDNVMARKVAELSINMAVPNYVRLDRDVNPDIYDSDTDFTKGFEVIHDGDHGYILSTGTMVHKSLAITKALEKRGIFLGVVDIHRIPCSEQCFILAIGMHSRPRRLISIEESFLPGGLGSYILEIISDSKLYANIKRFGISKDWCYRYGGRDDNLSYHGLDKETLIDDIEKYMKYE